jgi:hypothetical protein
MEAPPLSQAHAQQSSTAKIRTDKASAHRKTHVCHLLQARGGGAISITGALSAAQKLHV